VRPRSGCLPDGFQCPSALTYSETRNSIVDLSSSFLSAAFLLLLVLDPFGNIPIVAGLLRSVSPARRWRVILRECVIAYVALTLFLFFGQRMMSFLQLSEVSLGISGGVVLFLIALRMIFPPPGGNVFGESTDGAEPFIVPLAVPAIAGPSAMAMVMLLVSREPHRLLDWFGAMTLAMVASTVILLASGRLIDVLGERVLTALERLMGLILSALAIEMLLRGISGFVKTFN
jgi:MarC family membrane protein